MSAWSKKVRHVETRASGRCEYCRMHQGLQGATFHVEHEVINPDDGESFPLFNPRTDSWNDHFEWDGYLLATKTPLGRATEVALNLNHPRRVLIRQAEQLFDLFPP
jgi:hypothetical protein